MIGLDLGRSLWQLELPYLEPDTRKHAAPGLARL